MADSLNSKLTLTFQLYIEASSCGQVLTEDSKKEIADTGMNRMLKECCGDDVAKISEAEVFTKYCDKKTNKLHIDVFLGEFLMELAAAVIQDKQKLTSRPDHTNKDVTAFVKELKEKIAAKATIKPAAGPNSSQKESKCFARESCKGK